MLKCAQLALFIVVVFSLKTLLSARTQRSDDEYPQRDKRFDGAPRLVRSSRVFTSRSNRQSPQDGPLPEANPLPIRRPSISSPISLQHNTSEPSNRFRVHPLKTPKYPIHCFNPYSTRLRTALVDDCHVIVNHIILAYPNPMEPIIFGYNDAADLDLRMEANKKWWHGSCVIFVRNLDKSRMDRFRMADVAIAAERIVSECVAELKYSVGGTTSLGTTANNFYVGVGGMIDAGSLEVE